MSAADYAHVNAEAAALDAPLTRVEAQRAKRRLISHFGKLRDGGGLMTRTMNPECYTNVRKCWIAPNGSKGRRRGWRRMIHDVSHQIFRERHPTFRPHDGGHAALELEIKNYVLSKGWPGGALRPPVRTKKAVDQLARILAAEKRWTSKLRRAETALAKLARQRRYYERKGKQS
jgi:hypothetical protein